MVGFVGREINERRNIHDLNFNGEISFDTETFICKLDYINSSFDKVKRDETITMLES